MRRCGWLLAMGAALGAALGAPLGAQTAPRTPAPGWIGFFAGVEQATPAARPFVVVLAVADGSPAERAGLAAGDTLLEVDGIPLTAEGMKALPARLRAGDRIELTLLRAGGRRSLMVRAEARPATAAALPDPVEIRMDQARRVLRADTVARARRAARVAPRSPELPVAPPLPEPERTMPFTMHAFRDARIDSLAATLAEVERRLIAARSAESARLRELAARVGAGGRIDRTDRTLVELRGRRDALTTERELLRATLERVVEERVEGAARARVRPMAWTMRAPEAPDAPDAQPPVTVVRPMTPYLAGRDRVAGARVTPLNPGLAEYFGTARGVLIVEVAPGTPAEQAGLRPGDVLLRVGAVEVADLDGLRRAVGNAPADQPIPVVLLRRGQRVQLRLPR